MILQALAQSGGNQLKAAQQLGISSRTLRRKLQRYRNEDGQFGTDVLSTLRTNSSVISG